MSKTSKALVETWEWKEEIFKERSDLSLSEWANLAREQSRQLLEERGMSKAHNARQPKKAVGA
jgi:hypothetical protein